jgi:hypothetical protein
MNKVKVAAFSVSLDRVGAGPWQDLQNPLGAREEGLHSWFVGTDVFKKMNDEVKGRIASIMVLPRSRWTVLVPGSWVLICSDR